MNIIAFEVEDWERLAFESLQGEHRIEFVAAPLTDELLASSDIITLHVPSNEHTRNLISDDEFASMKEGVVLIDTARGDVVDIKALAKAIGEGKVAAAGLDVLPEEGGIREEAELLRSV